jgi:16S rRNA (cytidine1402-2'-O)-methyltransferase
MLYLVPTPVGNLEDITHRAVRTLREADVVACEDTRTTGVLLSHYGIDTPRVAYHDHNERRTAPWLVERMQAGETVALVTDAGSPGISDPGFYLVRAAIEAGVEVVPLPGATAFVPALTASGLPCERFVFEGFLPQKKGRQTRVRELAQEPRTLVLYESPHRLPKALAQLADEWGADRPAAVCRELTKKFEEIRRGTLADLHAHYAAQPKVKGEIVLVVAGTAYRPEGVFASEIDEDEQDEDA